MPCLTGLLSLKDASRPSISREESKLLVSVSFLYQLGQQDQTYKDIIPPHTNIRDILWSLRNQGEKYDWTTSSFEIFKTPQQLIALTRLLQTSRVKETVITLLEKEINDGLRMPKSFKQWENYTSSTDKRT